MDAARPAPGPDGVRRTPYRPPGARPHARAVPPSAHAEAGRVREHRSRILQRTGDDAGGAYRTTARYQLQVRDMAGSAA
ncbi:hypothetical protein AB0957_24525, partial [Streptomyces zhihengii]